MYPDDSLTLHTDLYQINMMQVYFDQGIHNKHAVFEVYFRQQPFKNGYAVFAGLERIVKYLENLSFSESDIVYLESLGYHGAFLEYLRDLKLELTVRSAQEGDLVFANEPIVQVEGPLAQCQLVETALLNIVNFQTLIATKAARIRSVIEDEPLMEFGTRRAQEMDAAIWGTRAAVIGGANGTSNVRAGKLFGIPVLGTHAHSLVQVYGNDYQAFKAYAETHKDCVFLVDTYDTLRIGVPAAIQVAREMGDKINFLGVRIDSGDIAYISKKVRQQLDEAGFTNAKIYASNDLDENTILNLKMQKAKMINTIKLSNNAEKVSTPGKKQVWRITSREKGKSEGDYITYDGVDVSQLTELKMFHPTYTYINKTVRNFEAIPLLVDIFKEGQLVYQLPTLSEIQEYARKNYDQLWDEYKRVLNPQHYPVDLAKDIWQDKMDLIEEMRNKANGEGEAK